MNNVKFAKTMDKVRKYQNIQLVSIDKRKNYYVLVPNCHKT